jgi:hypothetical protein
MAQTSNAYSKEAAEELLNELDANSEIKLLSTSGLNPPCRANTFDVIKDSIGIIFTEEVKSFYRQTNGLTIVWEYDELVAGEVNIVPIMDTMLEEYDETWKSHMIESKSFDNPNFQAFIKNLYSFDIYEESFQSTLRVVMEINKTSKPTIPKLWLWHLAGERFPLSLTFEEYIKKIFKTRGFYGWQYFFIDLNSCDFNDPYFSEFFAESCYDALPKMDDFMKVMPKLFPKDDFSEFASLQQKLIENYQSG